MSKIDPLQAARQKAQKTRLFAFYGLFIVCWCIYTICILKRVLGAFTRVFRVNAKNREEGHQGQHNIAYYITTAARRAHLIRLARYQDLAPG